MKRNGAFQLGFSDVVRSDGKPLWDRESTISPRLATAAEHDQWLKALNADDLNVYLIPVVDLDVDDDEEEDDDDEQEDDDGEIHLLSEDAIKEIRASLDAAEKILYGYLDKSFGSYKKAPDDHPVLAHSNPLRMSPTTSPKRNDRKLMGIRAVPISVQSRNLTSGLASLEATTLLALSE